MKTTKIIILIILLKLCLPILGYSQNDTIIYFSVNFATVDEAKAVRSVEIKKTKDNKYHLITSYKRQNKWEKASFKQFAIQKTDSTYLIRTKYDEEETVETIRYFKKLGNYFYIRDYSQKQKIIQEGKSKLLFPLCFVGEVKTYYESGKLSSIEQYEENNSRLVGNQNWLKNGVKYIDNVYKGVDKLPEYPGGEGKLRRFIANNTNYPKQARKKRIRGMVFIRCVIDENGETIGEYVIKGVAPSLDSEALRVVKLIRRKWQPAEINGEKVKAFYTIPINFMF